MFGFLKDFFLDRQTFMSALGDLFALLAVLSATPAGIEALGSSLGIWGPVVAAGLAYVGGAVSGRHTRGPLRRPKAGGMLAGVLCVALALGLSACTVGFASRDWAACGIVGSGSCTAGAPEPPSEEVAEGEEQPEEGQAPSIRGSAVSDNGTRTFGALFETLTRALQWLIPGGA